MGVLTTTSRLPHVVWWLNGWAWIPSNEMNLSICMPTPAPRSTLPSIYRYTWPLSPGSIKRPDMLTNHFYLVSRTSTSIPPISTHLHNAKLEMTRSTVPIPHSLAAVGGCHKSTSTLADHLKTMNKNECYGNLFCNNNL